MKLTVTEDEKMAIGLTSEMGRNTNAFPRDVEETADYFTRLFWDQKTVELTEQDCEHLVEIAEWGVENHDISYGNELEDVITRVKEQE